MWGWLRRSSEVSIQSVSVVILEAQQAGQPAKQQLWQAALRWWRRPALLHRLDRPALDQEAAAAAKDEYSKKAEARLTHPLWLRRFARIQEHAAGVAVAVG